MKNSPISEAAFQRQVLALAKLCGWAVYHTHDSRRSQAGFPDLVLARRSRLIFAELKSERGRASPAQLGWLAALREVPAIEVYLWRPGDLEEIGRVLSEPNKARTPHSQVSDADDCDGIGRSQGEGVPAMMRFLGGTADPGANGLCLRRAPKFLRLVRDGAGAWDALDQLDDRPRPGEDVYVYRLVENCGSVHLNRRDKAGRHAGRHAGGTFVHSVYAWVEPQPDGATLRDTALWRAWATGRVEEEKGEGDAGQG